MLLRSNSTSYSAPTPAAGSMSCTLAGGGLTIYMTIQVHAGGRRPHKVLLAEPISNKRHYSEVTRWYSLIWKGGMLLGILLPNGWLQWGRWEEPTGLGGQVSGKSLHTEHRLLRGALALILQQLSSLLQNDDPQWTFHQPRINLPTLVATPSS